MQILAEIRGKIFLLDKNSTPPNSSTKKRILSHFIKCCNGFYLSTAISLRDPAITLQAIISSIRASQSVFRELHPDPTVALAQDIGNNDDASPLKIKSCSYCKKRGHLRERYFLSLETPDGTK